MKVYVCVGDWGFVKATDSKGAARDWLASECYEELDGNFVSEICTDLNINDLYEADLDDLIDRTIDDTECQVIELELESNRRCGYQCEHETEQQPKEEYVAPKEHTYLRRSL